MNTVSIVNEQAKSGREAQKRDSEARQGTPVPSKLSSDGANAPDAFRNPVQCGFQNFAVKGEAMPFLSLSVPLRGLFWNGVLFYHTSGRMSRGNPKFV